MVKCGQQLSQDYSWLALSVEVERGLPAARALTFVRMGGNGRFKVEKIKHRRSANERGPAKVEMLLAPARRAVRLIK